MSNLVSGGAAATLSDVRRSNEMLILGLVRQVPGLSNADLSRRSGLAPQTVSVIVKDLLDRGLVVSGPVLRGKRGQPATPKFLDPDGVFSIGIEIGWRHVDAVLINFEGRVIGQHHGVHDYPDPWKVVDQLAGMVEDLRAQMPETHRQRLAGIGIAMPTFIWKNLYRFSPPHGVEAAWMALDIAGELAAKTGLTTSVLNDGHAACQGEAIFGAGQGRVNVASIFVSTFVCGGMVIGHQLFEGPTRTSANLGSILVVQPTGAPQYMHLVAGLEVIDKPRIEADLLPFSEVADERVWVGPMVEQWLERAAHGLAFAIANGGAVFEFEAAVVGGRFPENIRKRLIARTQWHMSRLPETTFVAPQIIAAGLGRLAPSIGGATAPLVRQYFGQETSVK